jgi:hypothetical protein
MPGRTLMAAAMAAAPCGLGQHHDRQDEKVPADAGGGGRHLVTRFLASG